MSNDHVAEPFRSILNAISNNHRTAREELREGLAALDRANGVRMPKSYAYDSKCEELAVIFLDAHRPYIYSQAEKQDLAQYIQDAIEAWFTAREEQ